MAELTIVLNFIIIFLLVTAIVYGFILNKRVKLIRESGRELSYLFRSFDDTILKAQNSVEDLKIVSNHVSEGLQKKIDKAALLIDELEFMGEKTTKAADKAGMVLANFKKIEDKISIIDKNSGFGNHAAMPVTAQGSGKSVIPEKPYGQTQKKKALEDLLAEVSGLQKNIRMKNLGVNSNIKISARPLISGQSEELKKKQFSIANALKALGYGD